MRRLAVLALLLTTGCGGSSAALPATDPTPAPNTEVSTTWHNLPDDHVGTEVRTVRINGLCFLEWHSPVDTSVGFTLAEYAASSVGHINSACS